MLSSIVLALILAQPAFAAFPMLTEDPGTQEKEGGIELELGLAARQGVPDINGREIGFFPQLSIRVASNVDLIVQAAGLSQTPAQAPAVSGPGDTVVDFKWRFDGTYQWKPDSLKLAVRAGLDLPTGDSATGLGAGRVGYHATAIAGWTRGDYVLYANAGYARTGQPGARANLGAFSIALTQSGEPRLRKFIEAATYSNPDPDNSQWPAIARTGLIYTVYEWLDVGAGFQARLNRSATRAVWLAGATLRW